MTTPESSIPVSIDYTSRDYYSLRSALIERVSERIKTAGTRTWSGDDPSDFGVALVEAFAYMGDSINYYIDRIANESFLPTATQRQNVLNMAHNYGYVPSGYQSAVTDVEFTNLTNAEVIIPSGTQVSGEVVINDSVVELIFTTSNEVTVPALSAASVSASHGEDIGLRLENQATSENDVAGELIGTSEGTPNQQFELSETTVVQGSVQVYVENGDIFELWQEVTHLGDYGPADAVYEIVIDSENVHYIKFGDGVSGAIPNNFAQIKANYVVGGGTVGNISTSVLTGILTVPGFTVTEVQLLSAKVSVINTSTGIGGTDPESTQSIRDNAPKALTVLNRAVSLVDYENIAVASTDVGKASALANNRNSVSLYVAPYRSEGSYEETPGMQLVSSVLTPTDAWISLKEQVEADLVDKTQIGVSVTVSPPSYVYIKVDLEYTKETQYTESKIESDIKLAILAALSYDNSAFGDVIRPQDIELIARGVQGVTSARVISSYKVGNSADRLILSGAKNELFVLTGANLTTTIASSNAELSTGNGIVPSVGTLSPAFTSAFTNYTLVIPDGTTSVTLVATAEESGSAIYINGALSTSLGTIITTAVGNTSVSVVVFAPDGVTTMTYHVVISRAS